MGIPTKGCAINVRLLWLSSEPPANRGRIPLI
jgi:hypothetical protein